MIRDVLALTTYAGERARHDGDLVADALMACCARHRLDVAVLLRGSEGFGTRRRLETERLLTLAEDLPLVTVAVDAPERILAVLPEITGIVRGGLVTVERARLVTAAGPPAAWREEVGEETRLTIYCGRRQRAGTGPAFAAAVEALHRHGVAGATVLLGVDGVIGGRRRRGAFFARNADVPLLISAVGAAGPIATAIPELATLLGSPRMTLDRVQVCKRDGVLIAHPAAARGDDDSPMRLTIHAGSRSRHGSEPLDATLIARLRDAGVSGATAVRGIWGYHGDHRPHGDRLLALRRRVPVVITVVDTPQRIARAFDVVDALTSETGLVTCERLPAPGAPAAAD